MATLRRLSTAVLPGSALGGLLALATCVGLAACLDDIPPGTLASPQTGSLSGTVGDVCDAASRLANAEVTLAGQQTVTDGTGHFALAGLEPRSGQVLSVRASGYLDFSTLVDVHSGQQVVVDLRLTPLFAPSAEPPSLDVLFVVDNSQSMREEQVALTAALPAFLGPLDAAGIDYHLGVTSTDLGTDPFRPMRCEQPGGDGGRLLADPRVPGCTPPPQPFVSRDNVADPIEAFRCIATLGTSGCGFEQPLEAARLTLSQESAAGASGFLRSEAALMVVVLTDEDDCSAADPGLFDTSQTKLTDPLGPLTSFRCFEFGVACDINDRSLRGPRRDCIPAGSYLHPLGRYRDFLRKLRPDGRVLLLALAGPDSPVVVGVDSQGNPNLEVSCNHPEKGGAAPAIRLRALASALGGSGLFASFCDQDLGPTMAAAGVAAASMTLWPRACPATSSAP